MRTVGPEGSENRFSDCFNNGTCIVHYVNGTITRWDFNQIVWSMNPKPPGVIPDTPPGGNPDYSYVNKTGPKIQVYDKDQGGKKKYKEEYQNGDNRAAKSEPAEPLCKGRNQMIIMGDWRVKQSVYSGSTRRVLQTTANEGPSILSLQLEAVPFIPDTIVSSGFMMSTIAFLGVFLTLSMTLF